MKKDNYLGELGIYKIGLVVGLIVADYIIILRF